MLQAFCQLPVLSPATSALHTCWPDILLLAPSIPRIERGSIRRQVFLAIYLRTLDCRNGEPKNTRVCYPRELTFDPSSQAEPAGALRRHVELELFFCTLERLVYSPWAAVIFV